MHVHQSQGCIDVAALLRSYRDIIIYFREGSVVVMYFILIY